MANKPQSQLPPHSPFTLDNTLGAAVIGFAASCVVFGILLTQVWTYFGRYGSDSAVYRILVVVILVLETTDQAFIGYFVYFYTITSAGNPLAIATGTNTWSIILQQAIGSVVGTMVKCCFASRVYRFSDRNIFITGFIVLLALGQLGVAMGVVHRAGVPTILDPGGVQSEDACNDLAWVGSVDGRGYVGSPMLLPLADADGAKEFRVYFTQLLPRHALTRLSRLQPNSIVNRLVGDAINTGVLTTAVSLSTLLLFDFLEGNLFFGATYFMLSKRNDGRAADDSDARAFGPPEVETNMFHLGTRMPSMHEPEATYLDFDT
ncbi:hypothetical protein B0H13DRAFT_2331261 [Mycena leptocephala]|nr:hypothetical protein B0H13DRAFT_2331261 [Mycena leptocephala]